MSDEHDLNALNAAASAAATAGDFSGAVSYLRQALDRQRDTLGPEHPDLATTLNNLALMLEQIGDTAEAGRCYRRAYGIALAALGPDDPAVGVSHANLAAFYRAHGSNGDEVAGSMLAGLGDFPSANEGLGTVSPAAPRPAQVLPPPQPRPSTRRAPPAVPSPIIAPAQAAAARRRSRAAVIGTAVVLLSAAGWWVLPATQRAPENAATADALSPRSAAEAAPTAGTAGPAAPVSPPGKLPGSTAPPATAIAPAKEGARLDPASPSPHDGKAPGGTGSGAATARVAEARLCGALSTGSGSWRCQPFTDERPGGAVYFYTRVASPKDAAVRHRWSRNGSVVRVVDLRIRANPKEGFRTYSRQTGRALESGQWQVALLDSAGTVLREETFVVR